MANFQPICLTHLKVRSHLQQTVVFLQRDMEIYYFCVNEVHCIKRRPLSVV